VKQTFNLFSEIYGEETEFVKEVLQNDHGKPGKLVRIDV
jgi:hypothetical protein